MIKEHQILERAVENLRKQCQRIKIEVFPQLNLDCDGLIEISGIRFRCEIKQNVKSSHIPSIINQCKRDGINLLVAEYISRMAMELLVEQDINVLDTSGNCFIETTDRLFIHITGNKKILLEKEKDMNFKISGIKVLFSILTMEDELIPSIRNLASKSGSSNGTVKHVIDVLESNDYIFSSGKNKFIKDRERLLDDWVALFNRSQRSALQIGRASWIISNKEWQKVALPEGMIWGGEPGVYLMNGYMKPAEFCIYTDIPVKEIVKTKAMVPNKDGDIIFYQKFWEGELSKLGSAILFYADLINQNNSRCLEAARVIRDERLAYTK